MHYFPQGSRGVYIDCPTCPGYTKRHPIIPTIDLYLYYRKDSAITSLKEKLLPNLSRRFNAYITLYLRPLESPHYKKDFYKLVGKDRSVVLPVFVHDGNIIPINEISKKLESLLPEKQFLSPPSFFMVLPVIAGGVVDGINPCAFAVLIFFISYLSLLSKKKTDILLSGIGFLLGIYITYILIGLGILTGIHLIFSSRFSNFFHYLVVMTAFILGIVSFYDFILVKQGKTKKILLQLPKAVKQRIHKSIKDKIRTHALCVTSFLVAIPVCLYEFVCTGQIYIPLASYIARISYTNTQRIFYLGLYNLMFIMPLLGVFLLVYTGISWRVFLTFFQHNIAKFKLSMCFLFFTLGALLWFKF